MSNYILDPYMGFPNPTPGVDPGPDYANNLQTSLTTIGSHDHSPGRGVLITPTGLNINADLPINGHNVTSVKTVNFTPQSSSLAGASPNLGCIYVVNNELYYNDGVGNVVPITLNGSVNSGAGSITGLPSGTASASFSAGTFFWRALTNTGANMDFASAILRNNVANSFGLTLSPPNSLAADYSLVLPLVPAQNSFMTLDNAGNMAGSINVSQGITASMLDPSLVAAGNPSGSVIMFGGIAAPTGYLMCDGAAISRSTYANLFSAIGTAYGNGDGSSTFNVPDFRGLFPRGVDNGSGNDPDASSRTAVNGGNTGDNPGSYQADQNKSHSHSASSSAQATNNAGFNVVNTIVYQANNSGTTTIATSTSVGNSGGNQANPKNLYINFIIKT